MAWYKYQRYLSVNNHANFDEIRNPGVEVPDAGIYRCEGCGHEIGMNRKSTLPPQNHHTHTPEQGNIRWRMVACAENKN